MRIEFHDEEAHTVSIAGSLSQSRAMPLMRVGSGRWIRVIFLRPGAHQYRFVVDGPLAGGAPPALAEADRGNSLPLHTVRVRNPPKRPRSGLRLSCGQVEPIERGHTRRAAFERSQI